MAPLQATSAHLSLLFCFSLSTGTKTSVNKFKGHYKKTPRHAIRENRQSDHFSCGQPGNTLPQWAVGSNTVMDISYFSV